VIEDILARHTGKTAEQVSKDTDRDFIMTAEEAVAYGMVDEVVTSRKPRFVEAETLAAPAPSQNGDGTA
jgi:ATP-dependent Clp protease protease subunit